MSARSFLMQTITNNCPIVTSYSENIKNNVDEITSGEVKFINPFMSFESEETISQQLVATFSKVISTCLSHRFVMQLRSGRSLP